MRQRLSRRVRAPVLAFAALPLMAAAAQAITFTPLDRPGAVDTLPSGINDKGVIVGTSETQAQVNTSTEEGFLRRGTSFRTIFFPGATDTDLGGINDKGVVFGTFDIRTGQNDNGDFCFTWSKEKGYKKVDVPIPPVGFVSLDCMGINDRGDVVGHYSDQFTNHGFLLTAGGKFTQLDAPFAGAGGTEANDINDEGDIVGTFFRSDVNDQNDGAFLLRKGVYTEIKIGQTESVDAYGINDKGDIVGGYTDNQTFVDHGFLLSKGGKLTTIDVPFANAETNKVTGINDKGVMVGVYTDTSDDTEHGFTAKKPSP